MVGADASGLTTHTILEGSSSIVLPSSTAFFFRSLYCSRLSFCSACLSLIKELNSEFTEGIHNSQSRITSLVPTIRVCRTSSPSVWSPSAIFRIFVMVLKVASTISGSSS